MNRNYINPYELLGINPHNPNLKKLKKNYCKLALICHPDKGGSEEAMGTLYNAYKYIQIQFQNCQNNSTYEQLENEFSTFCEEQKKHTPTFRTIWNNSEDGERLQRFNEEFEKKKKKDQVSFSQGYGDSMEESAHDSRRAYDPNVKGKITTNFVNELPKGALTIYQEPKSLNQSYGGHERFDVKKVSDFSMKQGDLEMCDYGKAFHVLGEENVKSVKIEKRTYKQYIEHRSSESKTYSTPQQKQLPTRAQQMPKTARPNFTNYRNID